MKKYLVLTLVISILVGIIMPLGLGVKDLTLIAITFSSVWFLYGALLLITTFLVKPRLKIKASRKNGVTIVKYELSNAGRRNEEVQR